MACQSNPVVLGRPELLTTKREEEEMTRQRIFAENSQEKNLRDSA
jgi:hypothetical protein